MFLSNQTLSLQNRYKNQLQLVGSLSNMFSDSSTPYLYYRIAEKIFCNSFKSDDLSRSDVAIDSKFSRLGIGLKTFLRKNDKTFQKIAEFNKDKDLYFNLSQKEKIKKICELRNERIIFSKNLYDLDSFIYHCVLRDEGMFHLYEENMELIDICNIKNIKSNKSSIVFNDGKSEYSFNLSKSTLLKRFETSNILESFDVKIIENPLEELEKVLNFEKLKSSKNKIISTIYLPLYGRNNIVYERSGLNQWNANGRKRDINEVYIPIPSKVNTLKPDFFPKRDFPFELILPNGKRMKSKVCQDGSKALMSYSNRELGKWILRDVLNLNESELLTYEKLQKIGIDSVRIDKIDDYIYEINFSKKGSYQKFINNLILESK